MRPVHRPTSRIGACLAVLMVFSVVTACAPGSSATRPSPTGGAGTARSTATGPVIQVSGTRTLAGKERSFGPSVGQIPGAVYQPDVVVIGGGADSILDAQDNGLVWTVKGSAPGSSHLAVGKVMVATAFATGRVERVRPVQGNLEVTLAPAALTDIFRVLKVATSSPVALNRSLDYAYANSPLTSTDGDDGNSADPNSPRTVPAVAPAVFTAEPRVAPPVPPGAPTIALPAPVVNPKPIHQGKFDLTPFCCFPSQGVHISYNEPTGRMSATVGLVMGGQPLVNFSIDIDAGGLEEAVFELHGPKAIEFQFDAATKDVSGNYRSPTFRVPIAFTFPIAGIPFTISLDQSVHASVQLAGQAAFSSKGEYAVSGGLGFAYRNRHFEVSRPTFSKQISALENAASLSVGINALSIGYGAHFSIGIGVIGFNGGPYFDLDANLAIDKDGSPPQTSLTAGCTTAAVYVNGSFGVGYTIPEVVTKAINGFLTLFNAQPISATGGPKWGPYTLWNPGLGKRCLQR